MYCKNKRFLAVIMISLSFFTYSCNENLIDGMFSNAESVIKSVPVSELAVYEFTFDIITQAVQTESGNIVLQISSAGILGNEESLKILYRGGVKIRYGVNISHLNNSRFTIDNNQIHITLPAPQIIGMPKLLDTGKYKSRILDIKDPSWIFKSDTSGLIKKIRETYQLEAKTWVKRFGLEEIVKKRAKNVISLFISNLVQNAEVSIDFEE